MFIENLFSLFVTHIAGVSSFASWVWLRPKALLLLFLIPLCILRPLRHRNAIHHGAPWLFKSSPFCRIMEGLLRHAALYVGCSILALLVLALGKPVVQTQKYQPNQNRPALVYVVDVSGSMTGILWERLTTFLQEFMKMADTLVDEKRIGVGVYYFSSHPLLNVSPTPTYRMVRSIVSRFNTASYGAGSGTEPAPSMWLSILDLVRMSDAELVTKLQESRRNLLFSCSKFGSLDTAEDFARFISTAHGSTVLEGLRKAMIGKRMVLGTDTEFNLTSFGDLCPWRLFRFAAAIQLPIDVVSTGPMVRQVAEDLPHLMASTGGNFYPLSESGQQFGGDDFGSNSSVLSKQELVKVQAVVRAIFASLTSGGVWKENVTHTTLDTSPQRSLLGFALVLSFVWIGMRLFRPTVGW